jgi:hypothetical protein
MDYRLERIKRKNRRHAHKQIWRRLNAHFEVLLAYVHRDRHRFESEMMRHPEMKDLFLIR